MKIYRTNKGIVIDNENNFYLIQQDWDKFINNDELLKDLTDQLDLMKPMPEAEEILQYELLPPLINQEIWAAGVTYIRSRSARMEESKNAGGGDFYDRVYTAVRPELFFKSAPFRAVGSGNKVRVRKDSAWNVPEPELTLMITSSGRIIGYTIGNDMSSRDIEGENPLYLPQAKTYDKSAAVGPCIFITNETLPPETTISMEIRRNNNPVFSGEVAIGQIKRKFTELAEFLFREITFPNGCLLMTGTGIVPPNDFTLFMGDEIRITIEKIGTLINLVE